MPDRSDPDDTRCREESQNDRLHLPARHRRRQGPALLPNLASDLAREPPINLEANRIAGNRKPAHTKPHPRPPVAWRWGSVYPRPPGDRGAPPVTAAAHPPAPLAGGRPHPRRHRRPTMSTWTCPRTPTASRPLRIHLSSAPVLFSHRNMGLIHF